MILKRNKVRVTRFQNSFYVYDCLYFILCLFPLEQMFFYETLFCSYGYDSFQKQKLDMWNKPTA